MVACLSPLNSHSIKNNDICVHRRNYKFGVKDCMCKYMVGLGDDTTKEQADYISNIFLQFS